MKDDKDLVWIRFEVDRKTHRKFKVYLVKKDTSMKDDLTEYMERKGEK